MTCPTPGSENFAPCSLLKPSRLIGASNRDQSGLRGAGYASSHGNSDILQRESWEGEGAGISSKGGCGSTPAAPSRELISISFDATSASQTRSPIPSVSHSLPITSQDGNVMLVAAQSDCFPQTLPSSWPSLSLGSLHATRSPDEGDSQRRLLHVVNSLNTHSNARQRHYPSLVSPLARLQSVKAGRCLVRHLVAAEELAKPALVARAATCQQARNECISALTYHPGGPHATRSLACLPVAGQLQWPAEFGTQLASLEARLTEASMDICTISLVHSMLTLIVNRHSPLCLVVYHLHSV